MASPGDLDPSFGTGGRATVDIQQGDYGFGGALSPTGGVVIVGNTNYPADRSPGVARLTPSGTPDPTFAGGAGFVTTNPSVAANDFVENVQHQPNGMIVVGGSFDGDTGILRYRTDGLPDTGFDGDGMVKTDFGHDQRAGGVQLLPDGRILWFGRGDHAGGVQDLELVRYEANGAVDTSFGVAGLVRHSLRPGSDLEQYHAALVQPDGKILVGGEIYRGATGDDWAIARLNPDGSFDTSFDGDGRLATHFAGDDYLYGLALQPDGRILAVGVQDGTGDIAVARYLPDGTLDTSFDGDGRRTIDLGGTEIGRAIAVQPDGRIVLAGQTDAAGGDDDMVVSRLLPDATLDPGFGVDGTVLADFAGSEDRAYDLLLQPDGKLVATGLAVVGGTVDFAAIRLEGDPVGGGGGGGGPTPPGGTPAPPGGSPSPTDATVRIGIAGKRLRLGRRRVARIRLRCPRAEQSPPCRGRVLLRTRARVRFRGGLRRVVLARGRFRIAAGRTARVRLRLAPPKARLVRRSRRARRVLAIVRVRDAAGNRARTRKGLVLAPRRAGHLR